MSQDISKTTIMILLVFTVVVSVMGTWTFIVSMDQTPVQVKSDNLQATASVKLNVLEQPKEPVPPTASGQVNLEIIKGGE